MSWYGGDEPYVPVAERRAQAAKEMARRIKKGEQISPVKIEGRTIALTFWGQAWCKNLESYSDFANRLPRGRTYARNGSVLHLAIEKGRIKALVSGSEFYEIQIDIVALPKPTWQAVKEQCSGKIGTLVELLQGKLSRAVMEVVSDRDQGLFPKPREITMKCSCPDSASMCKHIAAVMYGVGNRLDSSPELLFKLRGLDHAELIDQVMTKTPVGPTSKAPRIASPDLGAIFAIEIEDDSANPLEARPKTRAKPTTAVTKAKPKAKTREKLDAKGATKTDKARQAPVAKGKGRKTVSKTS